MANKPRNIDASIDIAASPASVYQYWTTAELLPPFMAHQRPRTSGLHVRQGWRYTGTLTPEPRWDVAITEKRRNELIAWKSTEQAAVAHTGSVRFEPDEHGHTRLHIHVTYNPPLGALGQGVATLLGISPKQQMGDFLLQCRKHFDTRRP